MSEILVLAEHRRGELREITKELLCAAQMAAPSLKADVSLALLGQGVGTMIPQVKDLADTVLTVEDELLANFNAEYYQMALEWIIRERKPRLVIIGHTSFGMDLAPALAVSLNTPLATDCTSFRLEDGKILASRTLYGGKVMEEVSLKDSACSILTLRSGCYRPEDLRTLAGNEIPLPSPIMETIDYRNVLEYVEAPAGEINIATADIIVSVGRGIKEEKNIPIVQELADALGGVLACSRPIVDKKWLPNDRQVGSSGKTVKPRIYLAIGISGTFQHVAGMKGSGTIIAINRDQRAPIFKVAHYGIVDDLFKVVPALTEKIRKVKKA